MAESTKIKLKDVRVIFYNAEDQGFGRSITIDCTDENVRKQITDWVKDNNIGKDNPGVANIKEYKPEDGDTVYQFAFKLNDYTKYAGINGLSEKDIAYGSTIDLIAQAFEYSNKFTGGKTRVGQSASAIVVKSRGSAGGDADLNELLGELGDEGGEEEIKMEEIPFN